MKKILFASLLVLILTGCKNEVKCSLEKDEADYKLKQEVTLFSNDKGIVTSADTILTMAFENEEEAKAYYKVFSSLEQKSDLKREKNKLIMRHTEEYNDDSNVSVVKKQLQDNGYNCN